MKKDKISLNWSWTWLLLLVKLYVIYNWNNKTNNAESYYILFYEVTFGPTSKLKLNGAEFALKLE